MFVSGLADIPVDVYLLNVMIIAFFIYMLQSNITLDRNWHLFKQIEGCQWVIEPVSRHFFINQNPAIKRGCD